VHEALDVLKARGVALNYLRVKGFPFGEESRSSSPITTASTSSSRTATRSCARC
jgi:hypothetical protein